MKIAKQNLLNNILVILLAFYLSIAIGWDLNESISWFSVGIIFIISYLILLVLNYFNHLKTDIFIFYYIPNNSYLILANIYIFFNI